MACFRDLTNERRFTLSDPTQDEECRATTMPLQQLQHPGYYSERETGTMTNWSGEYAMQMLRRESSLPSRRLDHRSRPFFRALTVFQIRLLRSGWIARPL